MVRYPYRLQICHGTALCVRPEKVYKLLREKAPDRAIGERLQGLEGGGSNEVAELLELWEARLVAVAGVQTAGTGERA